jgi:diguanylate cyclase (GGDEF)-like protein
MDVPCGDELADSEGIIRMERGPTIGLLAPFVGGHYFGAVLEGLAHAAAVRGSRIAVIQTLDGGSGAVDVTGPTDFRWPVGWERLSAFISVTSAVDQDYLAALLAMGKPVVTVGHEFPEISCPVVAPDNQGGIHRAVKHLVRHGHRHIAFAGYRTITDIEQRYAAYLAALRVHGITPNPRLYFDTGNNQVSGGEQAAREMLASGLRSTAVIAGNDNNAIGILRELTAAGCDLPKDQAVIGFDDIITARSTTPALTSVRQEPAAIGKVAVDLVLRLLDGEQMVAGHYTVPAPLVIRESCGCRLAEPRRGVELSLVKDVTMLQQVLTAQYDVSMGLLRYPDEDPRRLGWLSRTRARAACLGLWSEPDPEVGEPLLQIAGAFGPALSSSLLYAMTRIEDFPPQQLIDLVDQERGDVLFLVPVRTATRSWGILAVISELEIPVPMGREAPNQWGGLLGVALQHEAVLEELRLREEQLRRAALYDELTGLPNRSLFLDRLTQALQRAKRQPDYRFAVLFLDLDGFKVVNDSLGHSVGDRLLVQVAERVTGALRDVDTVARFGGDEFLMLLDGVDDPQRPAEVARRVHQAVVQPFHLRGQEVVVTASIGIALSATRYDDAEEVMRDADIAMYWAKSLGHNSHAVFDVAMHARAVHRMRVEAELRRALAEEQFEAFYQPIMNLRTHEVMAFEALIRWRHPERGLVAPAEFLPVAEESGLIVPIGRWMAGTACRQAAAWSCHGLVRVSVNVANRQFWDEGLLPDLDGWLAETGIDPSCLAVEITEGVIMYNVDAARKTLLALHERGLEVHIDDFGTGYSSLEALHRLPIDALKIDQSFVSRLGTDPRSDELVRSIVMMGESLGLDLIAEGVETTAQRNLLADMGCGYAQGYLLSRPVPPAAAEELISQGGAVCEQAVTSRNR